MTASDRFRQPAFLRTPSAPRGKRPWESRSAPPAPCNSTIRGFAIFLDRIRAGEANIEDYEIELDLPPCRAGDRCSWRRVRSSGLRRRKILVTIRRYHRAQTLEPRLEVAKLHAEQANLGKSRFLAAASHDLRQPLETLSLLRGILAKSIKDEEALALIRKLTSLLASWRAC